MMIRLNIKSVLALIFSVVLASCSYHLRGTGVKSEPIGALYVENAPNAQVTTQKINTILKNMAIDVAPQAASAAYIVKLDSLAYSKNQSFGLSDINVKELIISLNVSYTIIDNLKESQSFSDTFTVDKGVTVNANLLLSADTEKRQVRDELLTTALRRIVSTLKARIS